MKRNVSGKLIIPLAGSVAPAVPQAPPHNPRTLPQQTQRGYLASVSSQWRELTDPAREAWRALGRQLPGRLSGHQAYVQVNVTLVRCGLPQVALPPGLPSFGLLSHGGLLAEDTPQVKLLQVRSAGFNPERLILQATAPMSAGIENVSRCFREVAIVPGPTAVPADVDFTAAYLERFGQPKAGQRIFVRLTGVTQGFKGALLQCSTLVGRPT